MGNKKECSPNEKLLIKRYLIWCYKTTKEELDKVDRYFTQKGVDEQILKVLKNGKDCKSTKVNSAYRKKIEEFDLYKDKKFNAALKKKYSDVKKKTLDADYLYLRNRVDAIEKTIIYFFGKKQLNDIVDLYEQEMTNRILQAREHV